MNLIHCYLGMQPVERLPLLRNQESDIFRNFGLASESSDVMNLIRKYQRPKISAWSPNPDYLPAFYNNLRDNNNNKNSKGQKVVSQTLQQPKASTSKNITVENKSHKRKYQDNASCQVTGRENSTSPPLKFLKLINSHSSKTNTVLSLTKGDGKIAETEFEIDITKKLETNRKRSLIKQLIQASKPVDTNFFNKIIAENQRKAHEAHNIFFKLSPQLKLPLYDQPHETGVYHENKQYFISFREKLKMFLRKKCIQRVKTQKILLSLYSQSACRWKKYISSIENSRRHQSKEAKNRKYFETVFPELLNKKLARERSKRAGDHVLSEADFQEILHKLEFENLQYTLLKSSSAHPPALLDCEQRNRFFNNTNNLVADIKGGGEKEFLNFWTPSEIEIFKEKFIQHPKDFGKIASFLGKKSVGDCVKYYYLTKKRKDVNYAVNKKMQRGVFNIKH